MFDDPTPIFIQLADQLCAKIAAGTYPDDAKVPSISKFAVFHRVNPATTNRVIALLVERDIPIKCRGIGIFVADGARLHLIEERRQALVDRYVRPLITEAATLGIGGQELITLIRKEINP